MSSTSGALSPRRRPVVIVSNRGPVSFEVDVEAGEGVRARRGAGGLVSGLGPLVRGTDTIWFAAAMTPGDRIVASRGVTEAEEHRVRLIDIDEETWSAFYDRVCNEALWFAHHGLWDPVYEPSWPSGWMEGPWEAYRQVNRAFAEAVAADAPEGATVLVQDYHLCLLAPILRELRPDVRVVHFLHTPFAPPAWLRLLPTAAVVQLLEGLAAYHACGFHSARWRDDFVASCGEFGVEPPATFVSPLGPDPEDLAATMASAATAEAHEDLEGIIGDRAFLVRVDRIELSKNLLRGFDAFAVLLEMEPSWQGRVVFGAFVYPSRQGVADYDRYARRVAERVAAINDRFGTEDWTPIHYDDADDYPRSMAALARADVVVVNPVRDGLNLVAKEAMAVNKRHGQLVLSPQAGAWDELGDHGVWRADPFDLGQTAQAMAGALGVPEEERRDRADRLRAASLQRGPAHWLEDQVDAGEPAG